MKSPKQILRSSSAPEGTFPFLQFRIWLKDVSRMVWRRIQVPSVTTLREFHDSRHDLWLDGHHSYFGHGNWEDVYIDVLDATGRQDKAQQIRWDSFEKYLLRDRLRDYLKRLADFDDVLAEERALAHALTYPNVMSTLDFLIEWPDLRQAAKLILQRHPEIDGNAYYLLDPAAKLLEGTQPLAAVLLRRVLINDTLDRAKSTRYRHAARHLIECQSLHGSISDYDGHDNRDAFVLALQAKHRRKEGFWGRVREFAGENV